MEYGHRTWGRIIGAVFYIPAAVFWSKGYLNAASKRRVVILGSLLAFQVLRHAFTWFPKGWQTMGFYFLKMRINTHCSILR